MTEAATRLTLHVTDGNAVAVPCRAEIWRDGARLVRIWNTTGCAEMDVPAGGLVQIRVWSGIARDAATFSFDPSAGPSSHDVILRLRFDAQAWGWYGGDGHRPAWGHAHEQPVVLDEAGRRALAEGLDFMLVTPPWDERGTWLTPAEISQRCAAASPAGLALGWSLEAPKCPIPVPEDKLAGNTYTHGHGWAVGLSDLSAGPRFFTTGPNFPIIQEIHRQNGVVGCAHPARMQLHHGVLSDDRASELPFDFLSGAGYDAMDVLGLASDDPGTAERAWWALLNLGYRVAATANTGGGTSGETPPGRFRTYVQMTGGFSWRGLTDGIRRGACIASSGPFALIDVDGAGPGSECASDGRMRRVALQAWSGAVPGEHLVAVQLVRNGEIVQAWNLESQNLREWQGAFEVRENGFAWYAMRVISSAVDPGGLPPDQTAHEVALTSPIYFLPPGFSRPAPAKARFRLRVTDTADRDVPCTVTVRVAGELVETRDMPVGQTLLELPAGARLTFSAPGFVPEHRSVFSDSLLGDFCADLSLAHMAQGAAAVWSDMQHLLENMDLTVRLFRAYDFSGEAARRQQSP